MTVVIHKVKTNIKEEIEADDRIFLNVDTIEEYPKELIISFNDKSIYSGSLTIKKDSIIYFEAHP